MRHNWWSLKWGTRGARRLNARGRRLKARARRQGRQAGDPPPAFHGLQTLEPRVLLSGSPFGHADDLSGHLVIEVAQTADSAAAIQWTGAGDGENWSDPDNWSGGELPGADDHVVLENLASQVRIDGEFTIRKLTVKDSPTNRELVINDHQTLTTTEGVVVEAGARVSVSHAATLDGGAAGIDLAGQIDATGGGPSRTDAFTGGDLRISDSGRLHINGSSVNHPGTMTVGGNVTNAGEIRVRSGSYSTGSVLPEATLIVEGSLHNETTGHIRGEEWGEYNAEPHDRAYTARLQVAASLTNDGQITADQEMRLSYTGDNAADDPWVNRGTVTVNDDKLTLVSADLDSTAGTIDLNTGTHLEFEGVSFNYSGDFTVPDGSFLTVGNNSAFTTDGDLIIQGDAHTLDSGGLDVAGDVFVTGTARLDASINRARQIHIQPGGRLDAFGPSLTVTGADPFVVASDARMRIGAGNTDVHVASGLMRVEGRVDFTNRSGTIHADLEIAEGGMLYHFASRGITARITVNGDLTNAGRIHMHSDNRGGPGTGDLELRVSGTFTNAPTGSIDGSQSTPGETFDTEYRPHFYLGGDLTNEGDWVVHNDMALAFTGDAAEAVWINRGLMVVPQTDNQGLRFPLLLINEGKMELRGEVDLEAGMSNAGVLQLVDADVATANPSTSVLTNAGTLAGSGHVDIDVVSSGRVEPNGALQLARDFTQQAGGRIEFTLDESMPMLRVEGLTQVSAEAGPITVNTARNYLPQPADVFVVLSLAHKHGSTPAFVTGPRVESMTIDFEAGPSGDVWSIRNVVAGPSEGDLLNDGMSVLLGRLSDWVGGLDLADASVGLPWLPRDLIDAFEVEPLVAGLSWADVDFGDSVEDIAMALGVVPGVHGVETSPIDGLLEATWSRTFDVAAMLEIDDEATANLNDRLPTLNLDGLLDWSGELTIELVFGLDDQGAYFVDAGRSSIELSVNGGGNVAHPDLAIPGTLFIADVAGSIAADAATPLTVNLTLGETDERLDVSEVGTLETDSLERSLSGAAATALLHDIDEPFELIFPGDWTLELVNGAIAQTNSNPVTFPTGEEMLGAFALVGGSITRQLLSGVVSEAFGAMPLPLASDALGVQSPPGLMGVGEVAGSDPWHVRMINWLGERLTPVEHKPGQGVARAEIDPRLSTDELRSSLSIDGAGVKVGVLSTGAAGWASAQASGDLPPTLAIHDPAGHDGSRGTAMLEVIHDLAPGAELSVAATPDGDALIQGLLWLLLEQEVDVVVSDVIDYGDAWFEPTLAHLLLRDHLAAEDGPIWVQASGNHGRAFHRSTLDTDTAGQFHQFAPGQTSLAATLDPGAASRILLQTSNPIDVPASNFELIVRDAASGNALPTPVLGDVSILQQRVGGDDSDRMINVELANRADGPVELELQVRWIGGGDPPEAVDVALIGLGGVAFDETTDDALVGLGGLENALVVGASEQGAPAAYAAAGAAVWPDFAEGGEVRPNEVGALGLSGLTVTGYGSGRQAFHGTSVAAAHAGAVAALLRAADSDAGAAAIREAIGFGGTINAVAAAEQLGLDFDVPEADEPAPTPLIDRLNALPEVTVTLADEPDLVEMLLGLKPEGFTWLTIELSGEVGPGDDPWLRFSDDFAFSPAGLGSLGETNAAGSLEFAITPGVDLTLGFDGQGLYIADASSINADLAGEIEASGVLLDALGLGIDGSIGLSPTLQFADADGRVHADDLLDLDHWQLGLGEVEAQAVADIVFGFLDYVDVDAGRPNSPRGGDPYRLRAETGLHATFEPGEAAEFDFGRFRINNPDIDGDGEHDYTTGVFIANVLKLGEGLVSGVDVGSYFAGALGHLGLDFELSDLLPGDQADPGPAQPDRGKLEGHDAPPIDGREAVDQGFRDWLFDLPDAPDLPAIFGDWLSRIELPDLDLPEFDFEVDLLPALGQWGEFVKVAGHMGFDPIAALADPFAAARQALREAIRAAIDDAFASLQRSDAAEEALGHEREALAWARTAEFLGLAEDDLTVEATRDRSPLGIVIDQAALDPADEGATLVVKASVTVRRISGNVVELTGGGVSVNVTPVDGASVERGSGRTDAAGAFTTAASFGPTDTELTLQVAAGFDGFQLDARRVTLAGTIAMELLAFDAESTDLTPIDGAIELDGGERLLVQARVRQGNGPAEYRWVFFTLLDDAGADLAGGSTADPYGDTGQIGVAQTIYTAPAGVPAGTDRLIASVLTGPDEPADPDSLSQELVIDYTGLSAADPYNPRVPAQDPTPNLKTRDGKAKIEQASGDEHDGDPFAGIDFPQLRAGLTEWWDGLWDDIELPNIDDLGLDRLLANFTDWLKHLRGFEIELPELMLPDGRGLTEFVNQLQSLIDEAIDRAGNLLDGLVADGLARLVELNAFLEQIQLPDLPELPAITGPDIPAILVDLGFSVDVDLNVNNISVAGFTAAADARLQRNGAEVNLPVPVEIRFEPANGEGILIDAPVATVDNGGGSATTDVFFGEGVGRVELRAVGSLAGQDLLIGSDTEIVHGELVVQFEGRPEGDEGPVGDPAHTLISLADEQTAVLLPQAMLGRRAVSASGAIFSKLGEGRIVTEPTDTGPRFRFIPPQTGPGSTTIIVVFLEGGQRVTDTLTLDYGVNTDAAPPDAVDQINLPTADTPPSPAEQTHSRPGDDPLASLTDWFNESVKPLVDAAADAGGDALAALRDFTQWILTATAEGLQDAGDFLAMVAAVATNVEGLIQERIEAANLNFQNQSAGRMDFAVEAMSWARLAELLLVADPSNRLSRADVFEDNYQLIVEEAAMTQGVGASGTLTVRAGLLAANEDPDTTAPVFGNAINVKVFGSSLAEVADRSGQTSTLGEFETEVRLKGAAAGQPVRIEASPRFIDVDGLPVQLGFTRSLANTKGVAATVEVSFAGLEPIARGPFELQADFVLDAKVAGANEGWDALGEARADLERGEKALIEVRVTYGVQPVAGLVVSAATIGSGSGLHAVGPSPDGGDGGPTYAEGVSNDAGIVRFIYSPPEPDAEGRYFKGRAFLGLNASFDRILYSDRVEVAFDGNRRGSNPSPAQAEAEQKLPEKLDECAEKEALGLPCDRSGIREEAEKWRDDANERMDQTNQQLGPLSPDTPAEALPAPEAIDTAGDLLREGLQAEAVAQMNNGGAGDTLSQGQTLVRNLAKTWALRAIKLREFKSALKALGLAATRQSIGDDFATQGDWSQQDIVNRLGLEIRSQVLKVQPNPTRTGGVITVAFTPYMNGEVWSDPALSLDATNGGGFVRKDGDRWVVTSQYRFTEGQTETSALTPIAIQISPEVDLVAEGIDPFGLASLNANLNIEGVKDGRFIVKGRVRAGVTAAPAGTDAFAAGSVGVAPGGALDLRLELRRGRGVMDGVPVTFESLEGRGSFVNGVLPPEDSGIVGITAKVEESGFATVRFIAPDTVEDLQNGDSIQIRVRYDVDGESKTRIIDVNVSDDPQGSGLSEHSLNVGAMNEGGGSIEAAGLFSHSAFDQKLDQKRLPLVASDSEASTSDLLALNETIVESPPNRADGLIRLGESIGGFIDNNLEIVKAIDFQQIADWLNGVFPDEPVDLVQLAVNFDTPLVNASETLLDADLSGVLPTGWGGSLSLDTPTLGGELVFGLDTSSSPFYLVTNDASGDARATDLSTTLGIRGDLLPPTGAFGDLLTINQAKGGLATTLGFDFAEVAADTGRLRWEELAELANLNVEFDLDNPLSEFHAIVAATLSIPGLKAAPDSDDNAALPVVGSIVRQDDGSMRFELETGSLYTPTEIQRGLLEELSIVADDGHERSADSDEDVATFRRHGRTIYADDLGDVPLEKSKQLTGLSLLDEGDWYRFTTTEAGSAADVVRAHFDGTRGDVDIELYRTDGEELVRIAGDDRSFGDVAEVSMLGLPAGEYVIRVYDHEGGTHPHYLLSIDPPGRTNDGFQAAIDQFAIDNVHFDLSVSTNGELSGSFNGALILPFSTDGDAESTTIELEGTLTEDDLSVTGTYEIGEDANAPLLLDGFFEVRAATLTADLEIDFAEFLDGPLDGDAGIEAGVAIDGADVLLFPDEGGEPLDPDDADSPRGLIVLRDLDASLNPDGLSTEVGSFSMALGPAVWLDFQDIVINLGEVPDEGPDAGKVVFVDSASVRIPFFDETSPVGSLNDGFGIVLEPQSEASERMVPRFSFDDGASIEVNPSVVTDELAIADLLPFAIDRVALVFNDSEDMRDIDLEVEMRLKVEDFEEILGFEPVFAIGDLPEDSVDLDDADKFYEEDSSDPDNGVIDVTLHLPSLIGENPALAFKDLGPIHVGFRGFEALGFAIDGRITIGGWKDGEFDDSVKGRVHVETTDPDDDGEFTVNVAGEFQDIYDGGPDVVGRRLTTVWELGTNFTAFDGVVSAADAGIELTSVMEHRPGEAEPFEHTLVLNEVAVEELRLRIGDLFSFYVGGTLSPTPGPDGFVATFDEAGVQFHEQLGDLNGLLIEAGNIGVKEVEDDPETDFVEQYAVYALDDFFFRLADEEGGIGAGAFGLPEWFPLTVDEVKLFAGAEEVTGNAEGELLDPATMQLAISGGVGRGEFWPIEFNVEDLTIHLPSLAHLLDLDPDNNPRLTDLITNIDGVTGEVQPFEVGGVTVGGTFGLGTTTITYDDADPTNDEEVLWVKIGGTLAFEGFGLGGDFVFTEYGLVKAELKTPFPLPLGPTGLMIQDMSGGVVFGEDTLPDTTDENGDPIDPITLVEDNSPLLNLLDASIRTIESAIQNQFEGVVPGERPDFIQLPLTFGMEGKITIIGDPGVLAGNVMLGVGVTEQGFKVSGAGNVTMFGMEVGDIGILFDAEGQLDPTLLGAMQLPAADSPLSLLSAARVDSIFELTTEGVVTGPLEAIEIFFDTLRSRGSLVDVLDALAMQINRMDEIDAVPLPGPSPDPNDPTPVELRPARDGLKQLLLRGEDADEVTGTLILDKLEGMIDLLGDPEALGQLDPILGLTLPLELSRLLLLDNAWLTDGNLAAELLGDFEAAALAGFEHFASVINPMLTVEGALQPTIFGNPVGDPENEGFLRISREGLALGISTELIEGLKGPLNFFPAGDGLGEILTGGIDSRLSLDIALDFGDKFALFDNAEPFEQDRFLEELTTLINPFGAWDFRIAGDLRIGGVKLGQISGAMFQPGSEFISATSGPNQRIDRLFENNNQITDPDLIPIKTQEQYDNLLKYGGLMLTGQLFAPAFLLDPAKVITEDIDWTLPEDPDLSDFDPDRIETYLTAGGELLDTANAWELYLGQIHDGLTASSEVGRAQLYLPLPWAVFQLDEDGTPIVDADGNPIDREDVDFGDDLSYDDRIAEMIAATRFNAEVDGEVLGLQIVDGELSATGDGSFTLDADLGALLAGANLSASIKTEPRNVGEAIDTLLANSLVFALIGDAGASLPQGVRAAFDDLEVTWPFATFQLDLGSEQAVTWLSQSLGLPASVSQSDAVAMLKSLANARIKFFTPGYGLPNADDPDDAISEDELEVFGGVRMTFASELPPIFEGLNGEIELAAMPSGGLIPDYRLMASVDALRTPSVGPIGLARMTDGLLEIQHEDNVFTGRLAGGLSLFSNLQAPADEPADLFVDGNLKLNLNPTNSDDLGLYGFLELGSGPPPAGDDLTVQASELELFAHGLLALDARAGMYVNTSGGVQTIESPLTGDGIDVPTGFGIEASGSIRFGPADDPLMTLTGTPDDPDAPATFHLIGGESGINLSGAAALDLGPFGVFGADVDLTFGEDEEGAAGFRGEMTLTADSENPGFQLLGELSLIVDTAAGVYQLQLDGDGAAPATLRIANAGLEATAEQLLFTLGDNGPTLDLDDAQVTWAGQDLAEIAGTIAANGYLDLYLGGEIEFGLPNFFYFNADVTRTSIDDPSEPQGLHIFNDPAVEDSFSFDGRLIGEADLFPFGADLDVGLNAHGCFSADLALETLVGDIEVGSASVYVDLNRGFFEQDVFDPGNIDDCGMGEPGGPPPDPEPEPPIYIVNASGDPDDGNTTYREVTLGAGASANDVTVSVASHPEGSPLLRLQLRKFEDVSSDGADADYQEVTEPFELPSPILVGYELLPLTDDAGRLRIDEEDLINGRRFGQTYTQVLNDGNVEIPLTALDDDDYEMNERFGVRVWLEDPGDSDGRVIFPVQHFQFTIENDDLGRSDDGLVFYDFDEPEGDDYTRRSTADPAIHPFVSAGPMAYFDKARPNRSIGFNRDSQQLAIPLYDRLDKTAGVSVELWHRAASVSGTDALMSLETDRRALKLMLRNDRLVVQQQSASGLGQSIYTVPFAPIALGEWQHLSLALENVGDAGRATLFVNGTETLILTDLASMEFDPANSPRLVLGGEAGEGYQGIVDELRVWSKARTASEVAADFADRLTGSEDGLLSYHRFDAFTTARVVTLPPVNSVSFDLRWTDSAEGDGLLAQTILDRPETPAGLDFGVDLPGDIPANLDFADALVKLDPHEPVAADSPGAWGPSANRNAIVGRTDEAFFAWAVELDPQLIDLGLVVSFDELSFWNQASIDGPTSWELRSSIDGFTSAVASGETSGTEYASTGRVELDDSLACLLPRGTGQVIFRLYGVGDTGGWWVDNVQLHGSAHPVTECETPPLPPIIEEQTTEDETASVDVSDVLDPPGTDDPPVFGLSSQPARGVASMTPGGLLTYTPPAGFADSFEPVVIEYTVQYGQTVQQSTVEMTVLPKLDAIDVSRTLYQGQSVEIAASDLIEGLGESVVNPTVILQAADAGIAQAVDGSIEFTAPTDEQGTFVAQYLIESDRRLSTIGTIAFEVQAAETNDDGAFAVAGEPIGIDLIANDTPAGGARIVGLGAPAWGSASVVSDRLITYTPNASLPQAQVEDVFDYTMETAEGLIRQGQVRVVVVEPGGNGGGGVDYVLLDRGLSLDALLNLSGESSINVGGRFDIGPSGDVNLGDNVRLNLGVRGGGMTGSHVRGRLSLGQNSVLELQDEDRDAPMIELAEQAELSGRGTLALRGGTVVSSGRVVPGASPGVLSVDGDLDLEPTAQTIIEIEGPTAGVEYDQLVISGNAELDGTLEIVLDENYTPTVGTTFDVLSFASAEGAFADIEGLYIEGGRFFEVIETATGIGLRVAELNVAADQQIDAGSDYTLNLGLDQLSETTFTALIDWGDQTPTQAVPLPNGQADVIRVFNTSGEYEISIGLLWGDNLVSTAMLDQSVTVSNVPPTIVGIDGTDGLLAGVPTLLTASVIDNGDGPLTYTWSFSDGSPEQIGEALNAINMTFTSAGQYELQLTVTDEAGAESSSALSLEVTDPIAPTVEQFTLERAEDGRSVVGMTVTFDGPIDVGADAFTLERVGGSVVPLESVAQGPSVVRLTWQGAGFDSDALPDGQYQLEVDPHRVLAELSGLAMISPASFDFSVASNTEVLEHYLFYDESTFDDPARGRSDVDAIAHDRTSLRRGVSATPANLSNYVKGINGVFIDAIGLVDTQALGPNDFRFRAGNDDTPEGWATAPDPTINVLPGSGVDGSDRIVLKWQDADAVKNAWLEIAMLATSNTGLATENVFYFGSAIGETFNSPTNAFVDGSDLAGIRDNPRDFLNPAGLDNPYDLNRDSFVDGTDFAIVRDNPTDFLNALRLITPGNGGGAPLQSEPTSDPQLSDHALASPAEADLLAALPGPNAPNIIDHGEDTPTDSDPDLADLLRPGPEGQH